MGEEGDHIPIPTDRQTDRQTDRGSEGEREGWGQRVRKKD